LTTSVKLQQQFQLSMISPPHGLVSSGDRDTGLIILTAMVVRMMMTMMMMGGDGDSAGV